MRIDPEVFLIFCPIDFERGKGFYSKLEFSSDNVFPPLGILSIAAYLKRKLKDIRISILDGSLLSLEEIQKQLQKSKPSFVGLSPLWCSYENCLKIARFAKSLGAEVILGGHHAAGLASEILENRGLFSKDYCVDAIIQQDGEEAFFEIISGKPLDHISNLILKTKEGIKFNQTKLLDLNTLPPLSNLLDLIDVKSYYRLQKSTSSPQGKKGLTAYSRKGCMWRIVSKTGCIFCSRMEKGWRIKSPERFWQELVEVKKRFKPDYIFEVSDDFLDDFNWIERFSKLPSFYPELAFMARVDRINEKTAELLKKIQTQLVIFGLESGDNKTLLSLKKGSDINLNKKAIKIINNLGIKVWAYFVLGAPGETIHTLKNTLKFAKWVKKSNHFNMFLPELLHPLPNSLARILLIKKTGNKYRGNDLASGEEIVKDWVNNFCRVKFKEMVKVFNEINSLNGF